MLNSEVISWKCLHQNNLNDNLTICLKYQNGSTANINYVTMGCEQFPKENIFFYFNKKIINIIDFKKIKFYGFSFFKRNKNLFITRQRSK